MTAPISRRRVLCATGVATVVLAAPAMAHLKEKAVTLLIEQTYLKAQPGLRDDLRTFIEKNWFVMDQKGVDQGIFTSFWLMEDIDENADWDLVMAVGYPQLGGYENPDTKVIFDAIRNAHTSISVGGKSLKDLGSIVRHHRLKIGDGNRRIETER